MHDDIIAEVYVVCTEHNSGLQVENLCSKSFAFPSYNLELGSLTAQLSTQ
jgi:hypothetical protein